MLKAKLPWPALPDSPPLDFLSLLDSKPWHARARCTQSWVDPGWFFYERSAAQRPLSTFTLAEMRAKACCARCPVRRECMLDGLYEPAGIWGGLMPRERDEYRHGSGCKPVKAGWRRDHTVCVPDEDQVMWLLADAEEQARDKGWIAREEEVA